MENKKCYLQGKGTSQIAGRANISSQENYQ